MTAQRFVEIGRHLGLDTDRPERDAFADSPGWSVGDEIIHHFEICEGCRLCCQTSYGYICGRGGCAFCCCARHDSLFNHPCQCEYCWDEEDNQPREGVVAPCRC